MQDGLHRSCRAARVDRARDEARRPSRRNLVAVAIAVASFREDEKSVGSRGQ
jgi:hypothetical protein